MNERENTWKDVVREALLELGGQAHLTEINKKVEGHPKTRTNPTWRDTIRRVVRQYKIFRPVPPERSGIYKLVIEEEPDAKSQSFTQQMEIDHGIAQGMLVALGNIYRYDTFVPSHDQTARTFQGRSLRDFVTITDCSEIFRGPNLNKIREIDVLWFDEDDYGPFPRYAFEVEHTTGVRDGLDRLLKIPKRYSVRNYIIAPGNKEMEMFDRYLGQTPFRDFRDRFTFRRYSELEDLYNSALAHNDRRKEFGIVERKQ